MLSSNTNTNTQVTMLKTKWFSSELDGSSWFQFANTTLMSHKEHKVSSTFSLSTASLLMITTVKGKLRKYEYWSHMQCYLFSFKFFKIRLTHFMCVWPICIYTYHAHAWCPWGQKAAMEPLELKLIISRLL